MLRSRKFRPFETVILWGFAVLLLGLGMTAIMLAIQFGHTLLAVSSVGVILIAIIYVRAAVRGRPL